MTNCPYCGSRNVSTIYNADVDDIERKTCDNCNSEWDEKNERKR